MLCQDWQGSILISKGHCSQGPDSAHDAEQLEMKYMKLWDANTAIVCSAERSIMQD